MKNNKESLFFIGTMSGTSLDGLDVCAVSFTKNSYTILYAETVSYSPTIKKSLAHAHTLSGLELQQLHVDYGIFCGNCIAEFIQKYQLHIDFIASHGHTVFHTPHTGLTFQIGSGAHIAAITGITTINDFRTLDVAFGGQGAPLVPIGDELLFSEYDYCLNIGGFANVSCTIENTRIAWDICATNIVLNTFAETMNQEFDYNGELGKQGTIHTQLLADLESIAFYNQKPPKSLGREWVEQEIYPLLHTYNLSIHDIMRTFYEHIGIQIGKVLQGKNTKTLCTGGGVYNSFMIERIQQYSESSLIIPSSELINFKEALIFAYLGFLRIQEKHNCLASVTGARKNVCGGVIWKA
jgi:anhydro-N-acetylmuramic acid kinase